MLIKKIDELGIAMHKTRKKVFAPGTFISTPKRLCAIIQLCLAFSLFLWYASQPFMSEHFALRSRMLLYEYAMGTSDLLRSSDQKEKLEHHKERFRRLPETEQAKILQDYHFIQQKASRSVWTKIGQGLHAVFFAIPAFELAWIFFAVAISVLILLKTEGAALAAWLLPCLAFFYGIDNHFYGRPILSSPDEALFPTEKVLVYSYLKEPLSSNWHDQQEQLLKDWQRYLVQQWSGLSVEEGQAGWQDAIEQGEFNFTIARLNLIGQQPEKEWFIPFHKKENMYFLFFYVSWNVLFAWMINRAPRLKAFQQESKLSVAI